MAKAITISATILLVLTFSLFVTAQYFGDDAAASRWLAYMAFFLAAIALERRQ